MSLLTIPPHIIIGLVEMGPSFVGRVYFLRYSGRTGSERICVSRYLIYSCDTGHGTAAEAENSFHT